MVLGLGVVGLVGLTAGTSVALVRVRKRRATRAIVEALSARVRHYHTTGHRDQFWGDPERTDDPGARPDGQGAYKVYIEGCEHGLEDLRLPLLDVWGQPIHYRCPSPLHPQGWDLYSIGPNGIDEGGYGDDIVVVGDLAPVGSAR